MNLLQARPLGSVRASPRADRAAAWPASAAGSPPACRRALGAPRGALPDQRARPYATLHTHNTSTASAGPAAFEGLRRAPRGPYVDSIAAARGSVRVLPVYESSYNSLREPSARSGHARFGRARTCHNVNVTVPGSDECNADTLLSACPHSAPLCTWHPLQCRT